MLRHRRNSQPSPNLTYLTKVDKMDMHLEGSPGRQTGRNSENHGDALIPKLAFTEIYMGNLVGKGGFSLVYAIHKIVLDPVFDTSERQAACRQELSRQCIVEETDESRFVIKMLRDDLPEDEYAKGVLDLAVEARFLKRLSHPHIVQMIATANSDPLESRFFVVLEMLGLTLDDKISEWRTDVNKAMSLCCGPFGYCCANNVLLNKSWMERILVSKSIASAIEYLHSQDIIYRDLKPENIGIDESGQVKIFDFGLAKRLLPDDKNAAGLYRLTGNTGSLRYMAPEVALNQSYNLKADAYSFAIVFWQICSLTVPYAGYNCKMHADFVIVGGHRPKIKKSWPRSWGHLMETCWSIDIFERQDFDRIVQILDDELKILISKNHGSDAVDIKPKKKNKVLHMDAGLLDVDTRIGYHQDSDTLMEIDPDAVQKLHEVDII